MLTILKGFTFNSFSKIFKMIKKLYFKNLILFIDCLRIMDEILNNFYPNKKKMIELTNSGFITATDLADYLS